MLAAVVEPELPSVVMSGACEGVGEVCRVEGAIVVVVEVTVASVGPEFPSCVVSGACEGVGEVCRVGSAITVVVGVTVASVVLPVVIGQPVFTKGV